MTVEEAVNIVNTAVSDMFVEDSPIGPNGERALKNNAVDILRQAADEFGPHAEEAHIHQAWDSLLGIASQLGPQAGISLAYDMWFKMSARQRQGGMWVHKGLPLFRLWGLYRELNQRWEQRRYALMTLIEDAISDEEAGMFKPVGGAYRQAQFEFGLTKTQLDSLAVKVKQIIAGVGPEHYWTEIVLEKLSTDDSWAASFQIESSPSHHSVHLGSPDLIQALFDGSLVAPFKWKSGESLEIFASIAFGTIPGAVCRRDYKGLFQIDVLLDLVGSEPLSKRFGKLVAVECKDWEKPADIGIVAKLVATLNLAGCQTGILLSKQGVTGEKELRAATRVAIASFLKLGVTILILDQKDLDEIKNGRPITEMLVQKQIEIQAMT